MLDFNIKSLLLKVWKNNFWNHSTIQTNIYPIYREFYAECNQSDERNNQPNMKADCEMINGKYTWPIIRLSILWFCNFHEILNYSSAFELNEFLVENSEQQMMLRENQSRVTRHESFRQNAEWILGWIRKMLDVVARNQKRTVDWRFGKFLSKSRQVCDVQDFYLLESGKNWLINKIFKNHLAYLTLKPVKRRFHLLRNVNRHVLLDHLINRLHLRSPHVLLRF